MWLNLIWKDMTTKFTQTSLRLPFIKQMNKKIKLTPSLLILYCSVYVGINFCNDMHLKIAQLLFPLLLDRPVFLPFNSVFVFLFQLVFIFFFSHCHYSPLWALTCRTMSFNVFLSATNSLHLLASSTWRSLSTSSFHPFLGLPLLLVPSSSSVKNVLGVLSSSILCRWPNQLILCPFIHFTIFSPLLISSSLVFFYRPMNWHSQHRSVLLCT